MIMPFIRAKNLSLDIPVYDASRSFRRALLGDFVPGGRIRNGNSGTVVVRALEGININIESGDRVGLIGRNGSGKTTLLRVLAGIYEPDIGLVEREGQVTPLFNSSLGIDMDDTGLENIKTMFSYLTGGQILQDDNVVSEIIEFCDIGEFISLPVRTYSAGMLVRLCFATVTAIRPDILLLDEGIGAGDFFFSIKAKKRLESFYGSLGTLVVASHSKELISELCNKAVLLDDGKIIAEDTVENIYKYYLRKIS